MKRKAKVHPSPLPQPTGASYSIQHTSAGHDSLSVLNLLPAAILALAAVLSLQDREVLAFMITRSLKTPTTSSINSASSIEESKKFYRRSINSPLLLLLLHKPPVFDCECFDCYISYWFRWDSSPNRELIHQAIEAFEEHLANGEVKVKASSSSCCNNKRGRKKKLETQTRIPIPIIKFPVKEEEKVDEVNLMPVAAVGTGHKGYARRLVAHFLGVLDSRLWNLWG